MAKKRIFAPEIGQGIIGMQINLNLQQCIMLAQFASEVTIANQQNRLSYPKSIQTFLDQFKQFGFNDDPNLFCENEEVKSTGLYVGEKSKSFGG